MIEREKLIERLILSIQQIVHSSKVNPIKDSIKMLIDLFKIRYNNLLGKYKVK